MAKASDVAKLMIEIANSNPNEDLMTNLRLNKLLYFAQVGSLKRLGYLLIEDEFEAWKFGPVVKQIYDSYKMHGRNGIPTAPCNRESLTREEQLYIIDVVRTFSPKSTSTLVSDSHLLGGPWEKAYTSNETIISKDYIKDYDNKAIEIKAFKSKFKETDFIGYRNESNILVLPKELDYAE